MLDIITNLKNNNGMPQNPHIVRINITTDGKIDPRMAEFLPPEIKSMIEQDLGANAEKEEEKEEEVRRKITFDYKMVNANQDLKVLIQKLKKAKTKKFGMLLYGVSGSGKSYLAEWLAQELKLGFIKKRASDLQAKFVGETEQNIRNAFKEAKAKKAVLVFDEADSFLYDRKYSQREFEASSVNELLTQMEDHPYPFVMTTNLKDRIDNAAMRRFIFKIKFDYMTQDNIKAGIKNYFGKEFKLTKEQLKNLKNITAGDFKVAKEKMDILDDSKYTNKLIYDYLLQEQAEKDITTESPEIKF